MFDKKALIAEPWGIPLKFVLVFMISFFRIFSRKSDIEHSLFNFL